jgi:hypothetical protein
MLTHRHLSIAAISSAFALLLAVAAGTLSPAGAATAVAGRTITTSAATGATTVAAARPADAVAGDVMLAIVDVRQTGVTVQPPAGWTLVRQDTASAAGDSLTQAAFTHVVAPTDPSSFAWTWSTAANATLVVATYSGLDQVTPVAASNGATATAGSGATAPSVAPTAASTVLFAAFGNTSGKTFSTPAGMTKRGEATARGAAKIDVAIADQILSSAGETGDRVASTMQASPVMIGQLFVLLPSGTAAPLPTSPPKNTASPAISGTTSVGSTLTGDPGTWSGADSMTYAWLRCDSGGASCSPIAGESGVTYALTSSDAGSTLRFSVTARNTGGVVTAQSAATGTVASPASPPPAPPPPPPPPPPTSTSSVFWSTPIASTATTDSGSAQAVQLIQQAAASQGFLVAAQKWSWPIYHVSSSTAKKSVSMTASWAAAHQMNGVPIPADTVPSPDSDAHVAIIDDSTNCEYDLWQARQNADGSWSAGWGNATLTTGSGWMDYSATGSGQVLTAGTITPQEMQSGTINHALNFSYPYTKSGGPVLPARESDGTHSDAGALPEGAHLQLDPNLDLSSLGLTSWQLTIAKALQTYGMYLTDTGGGVSLYAQERQSYPWGADNYAYLPNNSLLSHLRVLTLPPQYKPSPGPPSSPCATFS